MGDFIIQKKKSLVVVVAAVAVVVIIITVVVVIMVTVIVIIATTIIPMSMVPISKLLLVLCAGAHLDHKAGTIRRLSANTTFCGNASKGEEVGGRKR